MQSFPEKLPAPPFSIKLTFIFSAIGGTMNPPGTHYGELK